MIILTEMQEKCKDKVVSLFKQGKKMITIAGFAGTGKAQPNSTLIPTPNGYQQLGNLKVGDYVFDMYGKKTLITGVFPQGNLKKYKVTLGDSRITYCNNEHLWSYYTSKGKLKTKTLKEMAKDYQQIDNRGRNYYKYKIPVCLNPIEFKKKCELPIHPYIIGAFLGDGCNLEKQLTLSSKDEEIIKRISTLTNFTYKKNSEKNYNWVFYKKENNGKKSIYPNVYFKDFSENLIDYSYNKSIPDIYKYSTIEERWELIRGLMDTDGCITENHNRFQLSYSSTSERLIFDIKLILESLGVYSNIVKDKRKDKYTKRCFSLNINCNNDIKENFFSLSRKKEIAIKAKDFVKYRDYSRTSIINIEELDEYEEMTCIMVDNNEHLYLSNNLIVTHNTTIVNAIIDALGLTNNVAYCTFTGKASLVLRNKGLPATTIHKLIYDCTILDTGEIYTSLKPCLDSNIKLIVVDEISMVSKNLLQDLISFNLPIIALGDHGQLEPIGEDNGLLKQPDFILTEIIRQAADNPIIYLSKLAREGKFDRMDNDKVKVLHKKDFDFSMVSWADQTLCGFNQTRKFINTNYRRIYYNAQDELPIQNEKIISLRNCWNTLDTQKEPLINGSIFTIDKVKTNICNGRVFKIDIQDKENHSYFYNLKIATQVFLNEPIPIKNKLPVFDFGYAITTHKSQGSEYNKVLLIDECLNKESYSKWLYTAITRAKDKLVIIKD